ncbi:MAG: Ig-like domain-containing protein [Actinomyces bowdenii]|nr:Ig-like domain-containing protein [Actinomyces bowdenii]
MPIQLPLPRRKYAAAVLAAVLLMLGGLVALLTPAAHADQNTGVKVTFEPLVLADKDGQEFPGKPAHQEDPVRMRFAWDASAANPQPGESFSITLPAEYRYREIGRKDDLILGNGTKVGDCVTTSDTLTCTFNTAISAATELKGSGNQMIVAQKVTQTNKTTFDANGTQTEIFHPNNEPILPIAWVEKDLGKYANSLKRESTALTWHIQFSGTTIANHLKAADGTVSTVTFTDVAGGGQVLNDDKGTWYVRVNPKQYGGGADAYFDVARADGTVMSAEHGTFTLTPTIGEDGMTASVTLTRTDGAFDSDTNYEIVYQSLAEGGRIVPGKVYTNSATLKGGAGTTVNAQMSYKDPISYDVQLTQGFGSFGVKKYITGAHQDRVTADTKVTVTVAYELPKGTTEKDYPAWTNKPPASPYTIEVAAGQQQAAAALYQFPKGTVITLTEQTDPKALPESLAWGSKIFSIDGTETPDTTTFTVGESVTAVGLYNEVVEVPPVVPSPEPEPSVTPEPEPSQEPSPSVTPEPGPEPSPSLMPEPSPEPSPSGNVVPVLPTPSDTPTTTPPQSTGSLARTGANVLVALLVSGGVLVTGAIALAARRRAE